MWRFFPESKCLKKGIGVETIRPFRLLRKWSCLKNIVANTFVKTNIFIKICQNLKSVKYFHKNGPFVSHIINKFYLFCSNFKEMLTFVNFRNHFPRKFLSFLHTIVAKIILRNFFDKTICSIKIKLKFRFKPKRECLTTRWNGFAWGHSFMT